MTKPCADCILNSGNPEITNQLQRDQEMARGFPFSRWAHYIHPVIFFRPWADEPADSGLNENIRSLVQTKNASAWKWTTRTTWSDTFNWPQKHFFRPPKRPRIRVTPVGLRQRKLFLFTAIAIDDMKNFMNNNLNLMNSHFVRKSQREANGRESIWRMRRSQPCGRANGVISIWSGFTRTNGRTSDKFEEWSPRQHWPDSYKQWEGQGEEWALYLK